MEKYPSDRKSTRRELVQRIAPDYLTTEFITMNNDDRRAKNAEQLAALEPLPL